MCSSERVLFLVGTIEVSEFQVLLSASGEWKGDLSVDAGRKEGGNVVGEDWRG